MMGPEYAHRNYRLCHLHFEEKWYKIGKCRASLLPNAVPTIFFGRNNTPVTSFQEENITEKDQDKIQQEETSSDIQSLKPMPIGTDAHIQTYLPMDKDVEMTKPSTSKTTYIPTISRNSEKEKLTKTEFKINSRK
ncbi:PREDICTED: uncharacterized protein LOC108767670 [Trachymyrmex cornetzi]|uniref:uncharacterized protein LOC108767670 n=1 Tax=Trachymyrmex cornetzi TaxID=471704 RepID=UPI00084F2A93|nr:PREDICTED: uncharacterized protein LOC108767670 [Trachymyrmex cornetzi]